MMSGSECSTSATPLASLLKQQQTDHSLHQSNFPGQSGSSNASLRTHTPNGGALQHEEAERFFQQQQHGGGTPGGSGQFANMDTLRRELESVSRGSPQSAMKGDRGEQRLEHAGARRRLIKVAPLLSCRMGFSVLPRWSGYEPCRYGSVGGAVQDAATTAAQL